MNSERKKPAVDVEDDEAFEATVVDRKIPDLGSPPTQAPHIRDMLDEKTQIRPLRPKLTLQNQPATSPPVSSDSASDDMDSSFHTTTGATIRIDPKSMRAPQTQPVLLRRPKVDIQSEATAVRAGTDLDVDDELESPPKPQTQSQTVPRPRVDSKPQPLLRPVLESSSEAYQRSEAPPLVEQPKLEDEIIADPAKRFDVKRIDFKRFRPSKRSRRRRSDGPDLRRYIKGGAWAVILIFVGYVFFKPTKSAKPAPVAAASTETVKPVAGPEQLLQDLDQDIRQTQDQIR